MLTTYKKYVVAISLLATLGMAGCRPDSEEYRLITYTIDELRQLLFEVPDPATTTIFTLQSLQQDTALVTPGGVRITLTTTDELFADPAGNVVPASSCGTLTIEVVEVVRKGDVLARGLRTATLDGTLLESGGAVQLRVQCGSTPLHLLKPVKVQIPLPPGQPPANDFQLSNGVLDGTDFLGWQLSGELAYEATWQVPGGNSYTGYEVYSESLGWIGAFRPFSEPASSFCVSLPAPYSSENTIVMLTLPQSKTAIPLAPSPTTEGTFCLDQAPVGFIVRVIVISKHDGQYWLGERVTEAGTNTIINDLAPQVKPPTALVTTLKNL